MTKALAFLAVFSIVALIMSGTAAAAGSNCKLVRIEEWPVRLVDNRLVIDGAINAEKIEILLDTGAMRTVIYRAAAKRLGLETRPARGVMFGVGGETKVETAEPNEIRIGEVAHKGWPMSVAGEHDPGGNVALILGEDFFQQADVEFDLAHRTVRLFQPLDCEGASLAYWATGAAGEVEIERVREANPRIVLPVKVNDQSLDALLDSGATGSILTRAGAARLGITPETPGVVRVGSVRGMGLNFVATYGVPLQSFVIGNETVSDVAILFGDVEIDSGPAVNGSIMRHRVGTPTGMILGVDFLKAHRVLVSHSQRKMYFTYVDGPVFEGVTPPSERKRRSPNPRPPN